MPIRKKLSPALKEKIKKDHSKLRQKDFGGDALTYLRQVKGAAKGRKAQSDSIARIGEITIPKDSEIYRIIVASAKINKMSVARFVKKYADSITALMKDGDLVLDRETDKLIHDINAQGKGMKVFVNDGNGFTRTSRLSAIFQLQQFKQFIASNTNVFLLFFRTVTKLYGDIYFYLPSTDEYEELEDDELSIIEMLDSYFPHITYLRSDKPKTKDAKPDKKIAAPKKENKKTNKSNNKK